MRDLKNLLTPDDRDIINATSGSSWIPKKPREVLLPYVSEEEIKNEEQDELDKRREKAEEVYSGYTDIIKQCKALETTIEERCKNVSASLSSSDKSVKDAMKRVFGTGEKTEITFEQYKACVKALAAINNDLPQPGDK